MGFVGFLRRAILRKASSVLIPGTVFIADGEDKGVTLAKTPLQGPEERILNPFTFDGPDLYYHPECINAVIPDVAVKCRDCGTVLGFRNYLTFAACGYSGTSYYFQLHLGSCPKCGNQRLLPEYGRYNVVPNCRACGLPKGKLTNHESLRFVQVTKRSMYG